MVQFQKVWLFFLFVLCISCLWYPAHFHFYPSAKYVCVYLRAVVCRNKQRKKKFQSLGCTKRKRKRRLTRMGTTRKRRNPRKKNSLAAAWQLRAALTGRRPTLPTTCPQTCPCTRCPCQCTRSTTRPRRRSRLQSPATLSWATSWTRRPCSRPTCRSSASCAPSACTALPTRPTSSGTSCCTGPSGASSPASCAPSSSTGPTTSSATSAACTTSTSTPRWSAGAEVAGLCHPQPCDARDATQRSASGWRFPPLVFSVPSSHMNHALPRDAVYASLHFSECSSPRVCCVGWDRSHQWCTFGHEEGVVAATVQLCEWSSCLAQVSFGSSLLCFQSLLSWRAKAY